MHHRTYPALVALCGLVLALSACSGPEALPDNPMSSTPKDCKPGDLAGRLSPFLVDEASTGLRQDLDAIIEAEGVAIVAASCERGIEILEGCIARGDYNFVGITPQDKTLLMKDQAQAAANLGFGVNNSLESAFSSGKELVLQYRLVGKYKTTVPAVIRGQLQSPGCQGATHFVTSIDVGAFNSFAAARGEFKATGTIKQGGATASGSSETTNQVSAGTFAACPDGPNNVPARNCGSSIRVSLSPVVEAKDITEFEQATKNQKESDCRDGFVLSNDDICIRREEAKVFLCNPKDFDECSKMCVEPSATEFSKRSCGRAANLMMETIVTAFEELSGGDSPSTSRLNMLMGIIGEDEEIAARLQTHGERFKTVCKEVADGNTCVLATVFELMSIEDPEEEQDRFIGLYEYINKGCSAGEPASCEIMEYILFDKEDPDFWQPMLDGHKIASRNTEYVQVMTRSCNNGNIFSCFRLSQEHVEGTRAILDIDRAAEYSERSCYGGLPHACIASGAMKLRNGETCNRVLAQYTTQSGQKQRDEEMDEDDPFAKAMRIDGDFAKLICKKSGRDAETDEIPISALQSSFELFLTGCELGDKTACGMSHELYEEVVAREIQRIKAQEELRSGNVDD